ncbi:MAG: 50S ribosomal protein L29 [Bacteroidia bacterium]
MKASVIRELTDAELQQKLAEETANLNRLVMNHAVSPIENPLSIRTTRKTVARIRTEIRKRELAKIAK